MAEVTDITPPPGRADIVRQQQRDGAQRQGDRAREDAAEEARDVTARVILEKQDIRQSAEVRARRQDAAGDAELANGIRRDIDLSADAAFDPNLPRGSIIDIVV